MEERHALNHPIFSRVPDQRILIIQEIQHFEQSHLIKFGKLLIGDKKIFVLKTCKSPKMGKSLDGSLFLWITMSLEGSLDSLGELIGEILAKSNNKINNFTMHVWIVEQIPQFLQSQLLIVASYPSFVTVIALFPDGELLELGIDGMFVLVHQAFYHGLYSSQ